MTNPPEPTSWEESFRNVYPVQAIKRRVILTEEDLRAKFNEIPTTKSTYEEMIDDIRSLLKETRTQAVEEVKKYAAISKVNGVRYFEVSEPLLNAILTKEQ